MDLVGPLPKSEQGRECILVIVDYATHYPEALPLRKATSRTITRELMMHFSQVVIPKGLLTDQGVISRWQPYSVPVTHHQAIEEEVAKMVGNGIIGESTSSWSSPNVVVLKPEGSLWFAIASAGFLQSLTVTPGWMT